MAQPWQPQQYADDYVPALMKVIEAKAEGAPVRKTAGRPQAGTNVSDLVARLRESLAAAERGGGTAKRATAGAKRQVTPAKRHVSKRAAAKPRKRVA